MTTVPATLLLTAPAINAAVITKSDTVVISPPLRGVYIGGTGNLNVRMIGGTTVLFSGLPAGALLPIMVDQILSTNTTATLIVGLY